MFIQIKDLLPKEFNRHGLKKEVEALEVINEFNKAALDKLGKSGLKHVTARVFKNKTLYVDASSSSAAQLLFLNQHEILKKINSSGKSVQKLLIKTIN